MAEAQRDIGLFLKAGSLTFGGRPRDSVSLEGQHPLLMGGAAVIGLIAFQFIHSG